MRRSTQVLLAMLVLGALGCGGGGGGAPSGSSGYPTNPSPPSNPTVPANTIIAGDNLAFNPSMLTVAKGTAVTFVFETTAHQINISGTGAPLAIPATYSQSVQRTFSTAGQFGINCTIHNYMTGSITVQ